MGKCRPVEITEGSFAFCRYSLAALLWIAFFLKNAILLEGTLVFLVLSVILRARRAPLIWFYRNTIDRVLKSKSLYVNELAIRFAHMVGAVVGGIGLGLILMGIPFFGWGVIGILAILKTSGAMGYCGAMKLYDCLHNENGQCCRFGKKAKKLVG